MHPAGLNFGDCFSYEVPREHSYSLLFIDNDFSKTDRESTPWIAGFQACPPSRYAARISGRASRSAPVPAMVIDPLTNT